MDVLFPYRDMWWWPGHEFFLTWVACVAMCAVTAMYIIRRRRRPAQSPFYSRSRSLAFYWPVYVWGFEAPYSLITVQFSGSGGPRDAAGYIGISRIGWGFLFASACIGWLVVFLGATVQWLFGRLVSAARGTPVGFPIPVFTVYCAVVGLQAAIILLLLLSAPGVLR
jgi:hypothetical protein